MTVRRDYKDGLGEPVSCVLEVDIEADEVTFKLYDLPPGGD